MPTLTTPTYTDLGNTGPTGPQGSQGVKGEKGNTGARGVAGPSGPLGPIGLTPILDISSNTGAAGTSAIVTQTGTAANVDLLFTIPKGDKGDLGTIEANYYLTPGQPMFTLDPTNGNTFINGTLDVSGNSTFDKNLTINGILKAGALVVDSSEIATTDPVLQLGSNNIDDDLNRGISFKYFEDSSKTGFFGYDQADNTFVFRPVASDAVNTARFTGDYGTAKFGRVVVGNGTVEGIVESNGSTPLVLQADGNKAQITINDGTNGVINIEAPGTGQVLLSSANTAIPGILLNSSTVRVGKSNTNAAITTSGTSDLTLHTNNNTNSGNITIADGAGGDISLTPNGSGSVVISKADINSGTIDGTVIGSSTSSTGAFTTLSTSGLLSANNGLTVVNGKTLTSNQVDINGGAIDGTAIGATSASTGAFTTLSASGGLSVGSNLLPTVNGSINLGSSILKFGDIYGTTIHGAVTGAVTGSSTKVNVTNETTTSSSYFPIFSQTTTGSESLYADSSGLTYNPGTKTLTTGKFSGALTGLASSATTAAALTGSQATAITANTAKTSFPGFGTIAGKALEGNTSLLQLGTTSTTALAGDTALLQIGTSATTALAGNTTYSTLALGTTSTTALAGDTALLQIGTSATTALAGDTALLQIGTSATTALAGDGNALTATTATRVSNTTAPTGTGDTGTAGEIRYDADYIYVCTSANTWKRVGISTW